MKKLKSFSPWNLSLITVRSLTDPATFPLQRGRNDDDTLIHKTKAGDLRVLSEYSNRQLIKIDSVSSPLPAQVPPLRRS